MTKKYAYECDKTHFNRKQVKNIIINDQYDKSHKSIAAAIYYNIIIECNILNTFMHDVYIISVLQVDSIILCKKKSVKVPKRWVSAQKPHDYIIGGLRSF